MLPGLTGQRQVVSSKSSWFASVYRSVLFLFHRNKLQVKRESDLNAQGIFIAESISGESKRHSKLSGVCKLGTFHLWGFLKSMAD